MLRRQCRCSFCPWADRWSNTSDLVQGPKKNRISPDRRQELLAKVKPGGEMKPGLETGNPLKQGRPGEQMLKKK